MAVTRQSSTRALPAPVQDALARGAIVLVPQQRAARSLRQSFDEQARQSGKTVWPAPAIFAHESWLASLWTQLLLAGEEDRLLLNRSQEHQLWQAILSADETLTGLESIDQLATLAAEAWQRLALYGGRARLPQYDASPDTAAFTRWADAFEQTCARRRYLSAAYLPATLNAAVAKGWLNVPNAGVFLLDFLDIAPAHAELFHSIELAGHPVTKLQSAVHDATANLHTANDDQSELRAAAQWLHAIHQADPSAQLALVVPNLADRRGEIDRALADSFDSTLRTSAYEFSLGQPLSETSAGACALALLHWSLGPLPIHAISLLLLSPFYGSVDPTLASAAAEFDAFDLRDSRLLSPEMTLARCARRLEHSDREALSPLLVRMQAAASQPLDAKSVRSPAHWADRFRELLAISGWTAAVERDSLSHQVHKRWESALDELATLDFDNALVSPATALDRLTRIASETIFAPESQAAPLQVLGPLEVAGSAFDALWFLGADDVSWPAATSPHPLLPWSLQRVMGMPGVDPERDAAAARLLTHDLAAAATQVVFSYAVNGEGEERRPSAMFENLNLQPLEFITAPPEAALPFDTADDTTSLPALPDRIHTTGAGLLELQAACSFRAFAEFRLGSTQPEDIEPGFDARQSGSLMHKVMQHFWQGLESQQNLRDLTQSEREQCLRESIAAVFENAQKHAHSPWDHAYVEVQRRRLFDLLRPWLDVELKRPSFTINAVEKKLSDVSVGPLRLNLRIDRIDKTDGGLLIIDYKSGDGNVNQWQGDRPDKPQLPLYAILNEEELGGIAFALLRAGKKIRLEGIAASEDVLPSKPMQMSLPEQVDSWKEVLEALAYEFADGAAQVNPKDYPKTCKHCTHRLLCRLDLSTLQFDEDAMPGDEEERVRG